MKAGLDRFDAPAARRSRPSLLAREPGLLLRVRGLCVRIEASDPTLLDQFPVWRIPGAALARRRQPELSYYLRVTHHAAGTRYALSCDSRRIGRAVSRAAILENLLGHVQVMAAERAPGEVFVHAGVVGWKGRAILLPGRSLCGKTSLVLQLARHGAVFYSDEYAVLDRSGLVHPYPRPLHLRSEGGGQPRVVRAEDLGLAVGTDPLKVALVLFPRYVRGGEWHARPLTPGRALLSLLAHTVCARRRPKESLQSLRRAVRGAHAYAVHRGEAQDPARTIFQLFDIP